MDNIHKKHRVTKIEAGQQKRTKFPDKLINRIKITLNKEIRQKAHWEGAHSLKITEGEAEAVAEIGTKFKKKFLKKNKSYDETWMRKQLEAVLKPEKLETMLVFLSNFYNVFVKRFKEEGQLEYIQESLGTMLEYMSKEPLQKLLNGKNCYWSWVVVLLRDKGLVTGAAGDVNLAREKLGEKARAKNMLINYLAYICPNSPKEDEKMFPMLRKIADDMSAQAGKGDWLLKEIIGLTDFEFKAFSKEGMFAVPGLRYYDVFFEYWSEVVRADESTEPPIHLLMKPLKGGAIKDGQDTLIRYDDLRDIILWSYVYRGLEEVEMKPTPEILYDFLNHALANVKKISIGGTDYVKVVSLEECMRVEDGVSSQDAPKPALRG